VPSAVPTASGPDSGPATLLWAVSVLIFIRDLLIVVQAASKMRWTRIILTFLRSP
jgi:hypothetical protein